MELSKNKNLESKQNIIVIGLIILSTVISFSIKINHFNYTFGDYVIFLSRWVGIIKEHHYLYALSGDFYNYTPLYMYILTLISKLGVYDLYAIKVVSIFFEYVVAFYVGRIAFFILKKEWAKWLPFAIVPLIPSIMLNSTFMSQCDSIYVSFLIGSVYYVLVKKQIPAIIFLGVAFSLKSQSAFILPFYFVYMMRGDIKWYMFLIVPIVYFISIIPAWLVGRPLIELLTVYISQTGDSYILSSYFPNIYIWVYQYLDSNKLPGMIFVASLVLISGLFMMKKKYIFTLKIWITLLFLSAIVCPFFLPSMHERYLYFGDVVAILYICLNWKNMMNWIAAFGVWFISYFSYSQCLSAVSFYDSSGFDHTFFDKLSIFPWQGDAFFYFIIIIYVSFDLICLLKNSNDEDIVANIGI